MVLGNQLYVVVLWTRWLLKVLSSLSHSVILWSSSKIWTRNGIGSHLRRKDYVRKSTRHLGSAFQGGAELTMLPSQMAAATSCCCKSSKLLLLPIFCPNKPHPSHADPQRLSAFKNMKGPLAQFNNVISSFIIGFQKTLWLAILQETTTAISMAEWQGESRKRS